jgi:hypothetical protein
MQKYFLLAIFLACASAHADIVQSNDNGSYATWYWRPLGQSFTATASESQVRVVSVLIVAANSNLADPTIALQVREGIGHTGAVLGSQTSMVIPTDDLTRTWIDFEFASPLALTPGQQYTLSFSATNAEMTAGAYAHSTFNPYSGGAVIEGDGFLVPQDDLAFRVLSVPEPTSLALGVFMGAALMLHRHRYPALK